MACSEAITRKGADEATLEKILVGQLLLQSFIPLAFLAFLSLLIYV